MASFKKDISGQTVTINVGEDTGNFHTSLGDEYLSDADLSKLVEKIRRALAKKKIKVNIPVTITHGGRVSHVRLTGIRADREVSCRDDKGQALDSLRASETCYRRFTPEEEAEYKRLVHLKNLADAAVDTYQRERLYVPGAKHSWDSHADELIKKEVARIQAERDAKEQAVKDVNPVGMMEG